MELNDLKAAWGKTTFEDGDMSKMLKIFSKDPASPIASLKRRYRRGIILIIVTFCAFLGTRPNPQALFSNVLFDVYIFFCIAVLTLLLLELRTIYALQSANLPVRNHITNNLALLRRQLRIRVIFVRLLPLLFVATIELMPLLQPHLARAQWMAQRPALRIGIYAFAWLSFYLLSYFSIQKKYAKKISYLEEIVHQLD